MEEPVEEKEEGGAIDSNFELDNENKRTTSLLDLAHIAARAGPSSGMSSRSALLTAARRVTSLGCNTAAASTSFSSSAPDAERGVSPLAFEMVEPHGLTPEECSSAPIALVLHGLMGSGRNWRTWTRALSRRVTDEGVPWRFALVDNLWHGNTFGDSKLRAARHPVAGSPFKSNKHPHAPCAVDLAADAVAAVAEHIKCMNGATGHPYPPHPPGFPPVAAILGHSLGGKIALRVLSKIVERDGLNGLNASSPQRTTLPRAQWWTLDTVPSGVASKADPHGVRKVIDAVAKLPTQFESREELKSLLLGNGNTFPKDLVDWLGTNLVPVDPKRGALSPLRWVFDVNGVSALYEAYERSDETALKVVTNPQAPHETHVVRAERSKRWDADVLDVLESANSNPSNSSNFHTLPNAGHWLHVDNPDGLRELIAPNLVRLGRELREWKEFK